MKKWCSSVKNVRHEKSWKPQWLVNDKVTFFNFHKKSAPISQLKIANGPWPFSKKWPLKIPHTNIIEIPEVTRLFYLEKVANSRTFNDGITLIIKIPWWGIYQYCPPLKFTTIFIINPSLLPYIGCHLVFQNFVHFEQGCTLVCTLAVFFCLFFVWRYIILLKK